MKLLVDAGNTRIKWRVLREDRQVDAGVSRMRRLTRWHSNSISVAIFAWANGQVVRADAFGGATLRVLHGIRMRHA
jgi:pantothenate kinase type III